MKDEQIVQYFIARAIRDMELHEMDEWFKFDSTHVRDPHPERKTALSNKSYLKPEKIEKVTGKSRIPITKLEIGEAGEVNNNGCYYLRAGKDCFLMIDEILGFIPYTIEDFKKDPVMTTVQPVAITFSITTK